MMNMNILEFITPPSIYHCCSTRKTFWEGKCTGEEKLFSTANVKICVCCNKTLLQSCSKDKDKSKVTIVNKTLLQNCYMDED